MPFASRYRAYQADPTPETLDRCVALLERCFLEVPDGRFWRRGAMTPSNVLGLHPMRPETISRLRDLEPFGGTFGELAALLHLAGEKDRPLVLILRQYVVMEREALWSSRAGPRAPRPLWPSIAELAGRLAAGDPPLRELVFCRRWFVQVRWQGDRLDDAMVSLRDVLFMLRTNGEAWPGTWREGWRVDWDAGRFTLLTGDRELTFTRDSAEASLDDTTITLRRPCEQVHYDLYVPLLDLAEALGWTLRRPEGEELAIYREALPVGMWVVDLGA